MVAILAIMVILLAVLALVVVNALKDSPWGVFTIACTIPIAIADGLLDEGVAARQDDRGVGRRAWCCCMLALVGGPLRGGVADAGAAVHLVGGPPSPAAIIGYGFVASVLPVWMLLCPRDYLSTFMKIGTILLLAVGILLVLPPLQMPAVTRFIDGTGPVFAGQALSLRLHHHRLRRHQRIPRAGRLAAPRPR